MAEAAVAAKLQLLIRMQQLHDQAHGYEGGERPDCRVERVDRDAMALRAEAATACRERITKYYSWDKVARDHERYFRWVLGEVPDYADSF